MNRQDAAVLVFTRSPEPGRVKTRLIPALGERGAMQLHQRLLLHTLETVSQPGHHDILCFVTPDTGNAFLLECADRFALKIHLQWGNGLGERMSHAIEFAMQHYRYVIVVGSDCPELNAADFQQVLHALRNGSDVVLIPAYDGGYVLIAMEKHFPELFTGVDWGTDKVLSQTLQKAAGLNLNAYVLSEKHDIDTEDDLQYCPASLLENLTEIL